MGRIPAKCFFRTQFKLRWIDNFQTKEVTEKYRVNLQRSVNYLLNNPNCTTLKHGSI